LGVVLLFFTGLNVLGAVLTVIGAIMAFISWMFCS
jgi:hypothetical protein